MPPTRPSSPQNEAVEAIAASPARSFPRSGIYCLIGNVTEAFKCLLLLLMKSGPERAVYGHRFLAATTGNAIERSFAMFGATEDGHRLLRSRPNSAQALSDRAALSGCPPGSLGKCYIDFIDEYGLDARYHWYLQPAGSSSPADPLRQWYRLRIHVTHDLRHVVAGYRPNELGEVCLMAFRFAQLRHFGTLVLTLVGAFNLFLRRRGPVFCSVFEAYHRGRHSRLLDLLPWEASLGEQLAVHRAALGLKPPQRYPASFAPDDYITSEPAAHQ